MLPTFDDQVRWGLALPVFMGVALLQTALAPGPGLLGGHVDLLLTVVTSWAIVRSCEEAMVAGPPAALLAGLLGTGPLGTPLLALLAPIGLAIGLRNGGNYPRLPSLCLAVALSTFASVAIDLAVQFLSGARNFHFGGVGGVLMGEMLLNVALAAALYRPLCIGRKRKLVRRARLSLS